MNRPYVVAAIVIVSALACRPSLSQEPIPLFGNRAKSVAAETPGYTFHSDFWVNAHMYLYGIGGGGPFERSGIEAQNEKCFASLSGEARSGWQAAKTFYSEDIGQLAHRGGTMREIRYQLNRLGQYESVDATAMQALDYLRRAAPAYRACLWEAHDEQNRNAIAAWVALLVKFGGPLQDRLSNLYRDAWPLGIHVDVAVYTDFAGANTESGPGLADHMMMSSETGKWAGFSALETLLHESSHIMFGPRHGAVTEALREAASESGRDIPRGLWHAISFYTSGALVAETARTVGITYTPYWLATNLYSDYHSAVSSAWKPYISGEVGLSDAATTLLTTLSPK